MITYAIIFLCIYLFSIIFMQIVDHFYGPILDFTTDGKYKGMLRKASFIPIFNTLLVVVFFAGFIRSMFTR